MRCSFVLLATVLMTAIVTVRFKNLGKPTHIIYVLTHSGGGWRITDIRYDDGSSLKKMLQADH
jgi:uncharacterized membrane protein YqjE